MRDESGEQDRPRVLDDGLQRIFAAALDLSAALQHVDDERAATRIRAALDLLDQAARDLRRHALDRGPVADPDDSRLFVTFHDDET